MRAAAAAPAAARSASEPDYQAFRDGLIESSVEVNKLNIPASIYALDENTARRFFQRYFAEQRMTGPLRLNLGYPVFYWGGNHRNLQNALAPVLLGNVRSLFEGCSSPAGINARIVADPSLHNHVFYSLSYLVDLLESKEFSLEGKRKVQRQLLAILAQSHLGDAQNSTIDNTAYPYVNALKAQLLETCCSYARRIGGERELGSVVALSGERAALYRDAGILLVDNGSFDDRQIAVIRAFNDGLPKRLRLPVLITCWDELGGSMNHFVTVQSLHGVGGGFNVFRVKVGATSGNDFPGDYDRPSNSDVFAIVLAHEYAHGIDESRVETTPALKSLRTALLKKAGKDHSNYLRSMFDDGFFAANPQEFVASMANQYFASSADMLRYALQKARAGNLNQIGQFALMASVFSDDQSVWFYKIDKQGNIQVSTYPVRKAGDLVTEIRIGESTYSFEYGDGCVTAVRGL